MRDLRPRTADLDELILRLHLTPTFGQTELSLISPSMVRSSDCATRIKSGASRGTTAKAYRLLKQLLLYTAVSDELILRNPCLLRVPHTETPPERVPPTLAEVEALADAIEPRWRPSSSPLRAPGCGGASSPRSPASASIVTAGTVRVVEQTLEL